MATNRRVTVVNPWIAGGEGQLRDLFPLPPWLFLIIRGIGQAVRHYLITIITAVSLWLWWQADWVWWLAFLVFPAAFLILRLFIITFWLWYRNPTIPLFARRP